MENRYVYIWEFEVAPEKRGQFLSYYGPAGAWAMLFRRSPGYLGTLLLNDGARPNRFITIDRWRSAEEHQSFLADHGAEYEALDRLCAACTSHEASLGSYWECDAGERS